MARLIDFPVTIVDRDYHAETVSGRLMRRLGDALDELGLSVLTVGSFDEARIVAEGFHQSSALLIAMHGAQADPERVAQMVAVVREVRRKSLHLPVFLIAERRIRHAPPMELFREVQGEIYLYEDTPQFVARQIARAGAAYLQQLLPPFFRALVHHVDESNYSWHTPGHGGGVAFTKSPVGRAIHQFFGENVLRADLSISVPELGSLLDHTGPIGDAETEAAENFGADHTFFVTNGTSTANKIVWTGTVGAGDVVLVDRNCHKSILHAIVLTGAIPIYLIPARNDHGIIGPIGLDQFTPQAIRDKIAASPFRDRITTAKVRLAVVTNSTYDGLCYNVDLIKARVEDQVDCLHFDEAWYGYAAFHPLYDGRHGMTRGDHHPDHPTVFATQSTHKLLAALSQASMIHVKDGERVPFDPPRFNESFMMHTSTSPQYGIIATLDAASRMMAGRGGTALVGETISEANAFRQALAEVRAKLPADDWFFTTWEPAGAAAHDNPEAAHWHLDPDATWHGFPDLAPNYVMLDPIKVTVVCPGLLPGHKMAATGVPAAVVARFLWERGIVVEKTGLYSFLILFSMGVTEGKWSSLLAELMQFKQMLDHNARLSTALPRFWAEHKDAYDGMGLRDLCQRLHDAYGGHDMVHTLHDIYTTLPDAAMLPAEAYDHLVHGRVESVAVDDLMGRVPAVMIVPYPPGIPLIMPGERFTDATAPIIDFMKTARGFEATMPGFELEIHGIRFDGQGTWRIDCVAD